MGGIYNTGMPGVNVLTGNETIPADTQLGQGVSPQVVGIPLAQLAAYVGGQSANAPFDFKNLLHGGDFTVNPWQRGTSFTGIANTLTYTADRWAALGGASSSISVSRQAVTDVDGYSYALRFGRAASNADVDPIKLAQAGEPASCIRFRGKQMILRIKALAGANFSAAAGFTATVYTGTATTGTTAQLLAGTWTGQATAGTATFPAPSSSVTTDYFVLVNVPATASQIGVVLSYIPVGTAGANDWMQFTVLDLQAAGPGITTGASQAVLQGYASLPERRSAALEQWICQRFAWVISEPASGVVVGNGMMSATNVQLVTIPTPVTMYKAPTLTLSAGTFKFNIAGTATAVGAGFLAAAGQTVNCIQIAGAVTATVGQATQLQGAGGSGYIWASADI